MTLRSTQSKLLLSAVLAGLPAVLMLGWSSSAQAQWQTGANGHALDANPRVGSGGFNGGGQPGAINNSLNNNIVTGNVSGLNYFHGRSNGEFDPNIFSGRTGSSSFSLFNAESAPVNYAARSTGQPTFTSYYNTGNIAGAPPANTVPVTGGLGYIPSPTISPLVPTGYDTRLELTNVDPTKGNLLTPGELDVAGPVDPSSGDPSMYSMSPLYGVRSSDNSDTFYTSKFSSTQSKNPAERSRLSPGDIEQMRDELKSTIVQNNGPDQSKTAITPPVPGAVNVDQSQVLNNAPEAADKLSNGLAPTAVTNQQLTSSVANNGEGLQDSLIIAPAKQSKQLAELEKRYSNSNQKLSDVQATEKFNQENRLNKSAAQNFDNTDKSNKTGQPGANPSKGSTPGLDMTGTPAPTAVAPAIKPILPKPESTEDNQPYIITSLATGISAKGLSGLMKTAEDNMRQGKFSEAVTAYDTAEQVAPNNPFVPLGRGFAELGSSYYSKADLDINRAISLDPAVLVGRYDLKGFLGEDRLKFVQSDLQDIADHEKSARPLVLLAYIAHNAGDDSSASSDLNEAAKRGGYDQLIKTLRQTWNVK